MIHKNTKNILSLLLTAVLLSACAASGNTPKATSSIDPALRTSSIDRAMERALADAEAAGNAQEVLALLEKTQARAPNDAIVAVRYARALRDDAQINNAIRALKPFTSGENVNIEAVTEMAMTQLTLGDFKAAEKSAQESVNMNPKNARGYLALGTAQDAQSRHQDAEVSFRKGVKYWQGDASPILNNLALNLASQGHLKEAYALIEKAQALSPNRMELERNRRIIGTLLETAGTPPPAPGQKPTS